MDKKNPALRLEHITKRFGTKVVANKDVSMDIYAGEILALLGENGSGKTTLMNMLSGLYFPDEGKIFVDGKEVSITSPKEAFSLGIGMIHQHFKLVDLLTATENIVLGIDDEKYDLKAAKKKIKNICDKYGFEVDPDKKIYDMSVSEKQTVEIVKVLYRGANFLILDEPTAVLTPQESDKLFDVIRNMKAAGKSIIIITHKMQEVLSVSDRVAILRSGEYICDRVTSETNAQELTDLMVGHEVELSIERPEPHKPKDRIVVKNLTVKDIEGVKKLDDVSFTARSGEILGIAGIAGSGQKELLEAIAGLAPVASGEISFINDDGEGESLVGKDPLEISDMGVSLSFVPEDRLGMGLVANMNLSDNMMLRSYRKGKSIFTDMKKPHDLAEKIVDELDVKTPSLDTEVRKLSGGNVQKVLVGREISSAPSVLLTAYAVRGLDINSSYTIYDLINKQKEKGVAVIFVGEDLDVLVSLCDKILVLCGGKVSGILDGKNAVKKAIGSLMTQVGGEADE